MNYFSVIDADNVFVGAATSYDFRRYQKKHSIILGCNEDIGEYLEIGETYYRDGWMTPVNPLSPVMWAPAVIERISEEEYKLLANPVEDETLIQEDIQEQAEEEAEEPNDPSTEALLESLKARKASELERASNEEITKGFDYTFDGDATVRLTLTNEDQMNLAMASSAALDENATEVNLINNGRQFVCGKADISKISNTAIEFKVRVYGKLKEKKRLVDQVNSSDEVIQIVW